MDEFELIARYFTPESVHRSVIVGVGDDGAILRPEDGRDLVSVVDTMVSGVHFPPALLPEDIGYRAVAVNVSDIAAMGGRARWMTLALTLPEADAEWLDDFACGLFAAAETFDLDLVGGDTTRGSELVVTVQITGDIDRRVALTRGGAKVGDSIFVTGTLGDAAAGLHALTGGATPDADRDYLIRRFARPQARLAAGQRLAPYLSAAIDLSDGLHGDLEKLLAASGAGGRIEINDLPLSGELLRVAGTDAARHFALTGGDDYELCFTSSGKRLARVLDQSEVPVTRIGEVVAGDGLICTLGGEKFEVADGGYLHFK